MSKCDLHITLENKKDVYLTGEEISGYVDVMVNKDCRCDGLSIALQWETHGKGNIDIGEIETDIVYEGDLKAGQEKSFPFTFQIPEEGPITYHGDYLNVDWYIKAQVDIPWAIDPKAELDFLVEPDPDKRELRAEGAVYDEEDELELPPAVSAAMEFIPIFGGLLVMGFALFFIWSVFSMAKSFEPAMFMFILIPGIFLFFGARILYKGIQNRLAQMRLGQVVIKCKPEHVFPSDETKISVSFTPQSKFELTRLTLSLVCEEEVVSGSGTNQTTHTNELYREEFVLASSKKLHQGEAQLFEEVISIPPHAAPSFDEVDNRLKWYVAVHFDIPKWPDWIDEAPLWVLF